MKRQVINLIIGLVFSLLPLSSILAQVKACITIPTSYPYPIKNKTAWICKGTNINLIGANCLGNTTSFQEEYSWVNLSNNILTSAAQNFFTPDTGKWELTLTNLKDYTVSKDTIHVIFFNTPNFVINGDAPVAGACLNQNVSLNINTPVGASNYNWYLESDPTSLGTTNSLIFNSNTIPGGSAFYAATANYNSVYPGGSFSCLLADTILAFTKQTPKVSLPNDTAICYGQSLNLVASITILPDDIPGDPNNFSFQWNGSGAFLDKINTYQTSSTETATKKYTVIAKNILGCSSEDTIQVTIKPGLTVNVGPALSVCAGSNVTLDANVTGSTGLINYTWTPSTGLSNPNGKSPSVTVNSNTTYSVSVKDQQGCTGSASKQINIAPGLSITISNDTTLCPGNSVTLNALVTGTSSPTGYTFKWTPGTYLNNTSIYNPVSKPTSNITYTVEISDPNGCKGTASTNVSVNPDITVTPTFTDSTTAGTDVVKLITNVTGGSGGFVYNWTPTSSIDVNTNTTFDVNPATNTTYIFNVTDAVGCKAQTSVIIDKLRVDLGSEDTLGIIGDSVKLNAFNSTQLGFDYKWIDSLGNIISTSPFIWVKNPGTYQVVVFNPITNSSVTDSQHVTFGRELKPIIEVPNVLSPTMTDENDKNLRVYGQAISDTNFIFQIFDQWGNLVYESHSFKDANQNGWNGSLNNNGKNLSLGVYTYTVRGEFKDGSTFSKTGTASLIK